MWYCSIVSLPTKYTKELLEPLVQKSFSYAEVLRKLGMKWAGGTQSYIKRRIEALGLDTSHFLGQARNRGLTHIGGPEKLHWSKILVLERKDGKKEKTITLRRAMIESGIPFVCGVCGCEPIWRDKPLVLQISHQNGDSADNRKKNLRFDCPNCHSQTEDFGGRSAGKKGN